MRVLIDACVLYPTVLNRILLGVAEAGGFTPLWSARILEEWARAALRNGSDAAAEIALARARFPDAEVSVEAQTVARLHLPDPDDRHVLAAAIDGKADELLTLNIKDFPTRVLSAEGVLRRHPDEFLLEYLTAGQGVVAGVVARVHADAERMSGQALPLRGLLKRARLPRLGKALAG